MNKFGKIRSYVSIGDSGKLILKYASAGLL